MSNTPKEFPQNFLWGSATSAHQVEGGNYNNDWWEWEQKKGLESSGRACNHYNLFQEDFDLAKNLNHNAHRLSLEWSRIEPKEGEFSEKEINHYREVFRALKERGFSVMLTLHHFTSPLWFAKMGGFLDRKSAFYFTRFAELCVKKFSDYIDFWITINEPNVYASRGFLVGDWLPGKKSLWQYKKVTKKLAHIHIAAYKKIHQLLPEAKVGIAQNYIYFEPLGKSLLNKIVSRLAQNFWNKKFYQKTKGCHDFLGINYYFHNRIRAKFKPPFYEVNPVRPPARQCQALAGGSVSYGVKNKNQKVSDLGWEIYPEGLLKILLELKKYNLPIYITENGVADKEDKLRPDFIRDHIEMISEALKQGVNVQGYFHWSLLDNFEWIHGFSPRFGLVEVNYETQERIPRNSAYVYAEIIKNFKF